jgi:hypothetical protein
MVVVGLIVVGISLTGSKTRPNRRDIAEAWTVCEQFVTGRLKAPSTAKFPWMSRDYVSELGAGKFRVKAHVDAQNSFGAMLRTRFDCTVTHIEGDRWQLEDLILREP